MLDQESLHLLISCQLPIVLYHQTYKLSGKEHSRSEFIQVWITWHGNSVSFLLKSSQLPLFTSLEEERCHRRLRYCLRPSQAASSADSPRRSLGSVSFTILNQFLQMWLPLWALRFFLPLSSPLGNRKVHWWVDGLPSPNWSFGALESSGCVTGPWPPISGERNRARRCLNYLSS